MIGHKLISHFCCGNSWSLFVVSAGYVYTIMKLCVGDHLHIGIVSTPSTEISVIKASQNPNEHNLISYLEQFSKTNFPPKKGDF